MVPINYINKREARLSRPRDASCRLIFC